MESDTKIISPEAEVSQGDESVTEKVSAETSSAETDSTVVTASAVTDESDTAVVEQYDPEKADLPEREPAEITLKSLLQAGVHFGHQTSRWCPKMGSYIHSSRNGIHIINLPKTIKCWSSARKIIVEVASKGGQILFVGTKKQAQDAMIEEARRCGAFYVSRRWLGGMMTNFQTVRKSIERMKNIEEMLKEDEASMKQGESPRFKKKERLMMSRELDKLAFSLSGIRDMYRVPDLLFVVDIKREDIAIKEANRLDIPVVALIDTNCDPSDVTYPIPSNDDGSRALRLFASAVADAVNEGKKLISAQNIEAVDMMEKESKKRPKSNTPRSRKGQGNRTRQANSNSSEKVTSQKVNSEKVNSEKATSEKASSEQAAPEKPQDADGKDKVESTPTSE